MTETPETITRDSRDAEALAPLRAILQESTLPAPVAGTDGTPAVRDLPARWRDDFPQMR